MRCCRGERSVHFRDHLICGLGEGYSGTAPMPRHGKPHTYSLTRSLTLVCSPSASLVCLPQSSGQCTAQLFSRWSAMIRELLEAVALLKCSTAVSFWSIVLKCPQRGFVTAHSFLKQIVTNSASEFVFIHIQTGSRHSAFLRTKRIQTSAFTVITPS